MNIEIFSEVLQDTLVLPQQQNRTLPAINVQKPKIDLERADEIIRQFEQREQEIIQSQQAVKKPSAKPVEPIEAPTVEVDTLPLKDTVSITTIVPSHENGFSSEARPVGSLSSVTFFIICGWALLVFIKYYFRKNLLETIQSFYSYRQAMRMYEERRESDRQADFLSNILFIWIAGIFISMVVHFFGPGPLWNNHILSVLFFSVVTGLLYILKALLWNILGFIFMVQTFSKIYIYNMFLFNRNTGLLIFPLVTVIPFISGEIMPYIIYSVIIAYALSFIFKLLRIFQIIYGLNISVFYFILYLCSLEILPLLLLAKCCKMLWEFNLFL